MMEKKDAAPIVVAKGQDEIAFKIIQIAEEKWCSGSRKINL